MRSKPFTVFFGTILGAAIGMMDTAGCWLPHSNGAIQGVQRQRRCHTCPRTPPDDTTREEVEHHSKVDPAFTRLNIRQVGSPFLVFRCGRKVLVQMIRGNSVIMRTVGGHFETPCPNNAQLLLMHQAPYTTVSNRKTQCFQRCRHTWSAITLTVLRMKGAHMHD